MYTVHQKWQAMQYLLHSYNTDAYTEVKALFLYNSFTVNHANRYLHKVAVHVLHGNSQATSKEQHYYFCVGTSAVTM